MKQIYILLLFLLMPALSFGQQFESHRASSLFVLPQTSEDIVFIGNSITNLHNWNEAFGGARILNRGISGETTQGLETRLDAYIDGQPKKIFLMLGTNDFEPNVNRTPAQIAGTMGSIISRIVKKCPNSELYVQSILPSTYKTRTLANIQATNALIKEYVENLGNANVQYLDIYSLLTGIAGQADKTLTYDGLHLTAKAYSIWCHAIEQYVGHNTVYADPDKMQLNSGGLATTQGMRTTMCAALPVEPGDALVIGGEMAAGGEWWELLGNTHVKNRATGWWTANTTLDQVNAMLDPIFHDGAAPAQVFLYAGANEMNGNGAVDNAVTKYKNIVGKIRELSPKSHIYLLSLIPTSNANRNSNRYTPFNNAIKAYAETTDSVTYLDIYTPFVKNGVADPDYIADDYLYGRGYAKIAGIIAPYVPGSNPVTEEEAVQLETSRKNAIQQSLMPKASSDNEQHWYTFCSSLRNNRYMTETADGSLTGGTETGLANTLWKFVERQDGTFDIINDSTGNYISPEAEYNKSVSTTATQPSAGWTVRNAATLGMFIISSGSVELNQTTLRGNPIYNWSKNKDGNDITDLGCQTAIREVFKGKATGISMAGTGKPEAHAAVYDLQGRRLGTDVKGLPRGIYIMNGKKYINY